MVTFLMDMEEFFLLMVDHPETARYILDQMVAFELEFYRRCFEAAGGRLDILRPHDDYGTQISLLFSVEMWREFFAENTRHLVRLAHEYGAFYQQHSCGAVAPIIPELIACGVDVLEPLQKVPGLYPQELKARYEGQLTFHGGIDTQSLLPRGTRSRCSARPALTWSCSARMAAISSWPAKASRATSLKISRRSTASPASSDPAALAVL
ncbi:MAG: uroporphyrinogen decarboxylase family protein [Hydrogeniiclostridium mannosilyticum]